jgi:hypothetical protein
MNDQLQRHTMYHQRHDFTLPAEDRTGLHAFQTGFGLAPARRGYFARLLNALHRSRRLQATRVIRQHRHLVAKGHSLKTANKVLKPNDFIEGNVAMASTDHARFQRPNKSLSLRAWVLIAVLGFAALHVVGAIVLIHASNSRPSETSTATISRD